MSKYSRQPLTRGTKHNPPVGWLPAATIAADVAAVRVDDSNDSLPLAPFRVTLHFPSVIDKISPFAQDSENPVAAVCAPFLLAEPQQSFSPDGDLPEGVVMVLDEVSLSFDQRAEASAIEGTGGAGDLAPTQIDRLNLRVSVVAKACSAFDDNAGVDPDQEIWSSPLFAKQLGGVDFRTNPALWRDIQQQVDPRKTLAVIVEVPDLYDATTPLMLPSMTVSLRFLRTTFSRINNSTTGTVQNMPTLQDGVPVPDSGFGISVPLSSVTALADGAGGIHTMLEAFDLKLHEGLKGGVNREGYLPNVEHLDFTDGYHVIAVPMFTNVGPTGFVLSANAPNLPYATGIATPDKTVDQRIIPIEQPLVLHHVLVALNWCAPNATAINAGLIPTAATLHHKVGVALYGGPSSDSVEFQQVAYVDVTPVTKATYQIDRWRYKWTQFMTRAPAYDKQNFDLLVCPLTGTGGAAFEDMFTSVSIAQGKPIWMGRSTWGLRTRSNINGVAPATAGCEQSIVVRMSIEDAGGLYGPAGGGNQTTDADVLVGFGGHWVYLLCTTGLTSGRFDRSK